MPTDLLSEAGNQARELIMLFVALTAIGTLMGLVKSRRRQRRENSDLRKHVGVSYLKSE